MRLSLCKVAILQLNQRWEKAQLSLYFFLKDNEAAVCLLRLPFLKNILEKKNFRTFLQHLRVRIMEKGGNGDDITI